MRMLFVAVTGIACLTAMLAGATMCSPMTDQKEIAEWGPETRGCRFAVTSERQQYRFDQPVRLRLVLENTSESPVSIVRTNLMAVYRFDVRLPDGNPAPLTLEGRRQRELPTDERSIVTMEHGQSDSGGVAMLNRLYDMSLRGEYTVTVYRHVFPPGENTKPVQVRSNTLKIVVHERELETETK